MSDAFEKWYETVKRHQRAREDAMPPLQRAWARTKRWCRNKWWRAIDWLTYPSPEPQPDPSILKDKPHFRTLMEPTKMIVRWMLRMGNNMVNEEKWNKMK
jgi:hypothetical protein